MLFCESCNQQLLHGGGGGHGLRTHGVQTGDVFSWWKETWAVCMTSRFLWSSDSTLSTLSHHFSSSHLLAKCIKLSKNNRAFWYLEISQRISLHRKKWTRICQTIFCSFVQKLQVTRTLHSIFEDGSTADNIHITLLFSFFPPEVHCCHSF